MHDSSVRGFRFAPLRCSALLYLRCVCVCVCVYVCVCVVPVCVPAANCARARWYTLVPFGGTPYAVTTLAEKCPKHRQLGSNKQGDPLSPLLFGLYMDRLEQYMLSVCRDLGARLTESQRVSLLLYADDLVLLAESPEELQRLLNALHSFTVSNHMTVNVSKSACGDPVSVATQFLACGDPQWRGAVMYAGEVLPTVSKFTYLGVDFYASPQAGSRTPTCTNTAGEGDQSYACYETAVSGVRSPQ